MKKHLIAATALVVTLVGCSRSSTDGMGSSGSSESGASSAPLPVQRSPRSSSDTNSIIATNEISGAARSSSTSDISAPPQPQAQPEAQPEPQPQPQPQPEAQPQQSPEQSTPPSTTP